VKDGLAAAIDAGDRETVERLVAGLSTEERLGALFHYCDNLEEQLQQVEAVRLLLDAGCPVHDVDDPLYHVTPLHVAAWFGHADIVELLLERGATIDMRDDEYNATPLSWALAACRRECRRPGGDYVRVITTLLDRGATWYAGNSPTGDPEIDAIFEPLLATRFDGAVASGDEQLLERLIARGPSQAELDLGLCVAAELGKTDLCRRLIHAGAVACVPGYSSWTPLHAACWFGHREALELLLDAGADVHIPNDRGGTVWHSLAESGASREMIDVVVRHGGLPGINTPSKFGYTPLDLAIIEKHTDAIEYMRSLGAEPRREQLPS
jgi:cytohesin